MTTLLLVLMVCAFTTAAIAERKGYPPRSWFWLGAFLGVIATVILLIQPSKDVQEAASDDHDVPDPL